MFGEVFKAVATVVDLADAAVGVAVKPVVDGAEFIAEGLREILEGEDG